MVNHMELIDKVREQISTLADRAQDASRQGAAKLADLQTRRRAESLLRELGAVVYAQNRGEKDLDAPAEIERLVTSLKSLEAEGVVIDIRRMESDPEVIDPDGQFGLDDV